MECKGRVGLAVAGGEVGGGAMAGDRRSSPNERYGAQFSLILEPKRSGAQGDPHQGGAQGRKSRNRGRGGEVDGEVLRWRR